MTTGAGPATWRNWSGVARCTPAHLIRPTNEDAVVTAVQMATDAGLTVRAAGTGHSFNSIATTDGVLLDLTRFTGVVEVDHRTPAVTVRPGTTVHSLCQALDRLGLALPNVGTLGHQTIAGAVSTGNHGTGRQHPALAGEILRLRLVTADGSVLTVDAHNQPDLFRCAKTALGSLGIITAVTLRCVPAFRLRVRFEERPLAEITAELPDRLGQTDHVAATWLAWRDHVAVRSASVTADRPTPRSRPRQFTNTFEELRCGVLGQIGRFSPNIMGGLADRLSGARPSEYVGVSHHVFTFPQPVRLLAMEYALPLERAGAALQEVSQILRRCARYSPYSVLVRSAAGDDAPLSPSYGRATAFVNLTIPRTAGYIELFRAIEEPLRALEGRPHWGKAHTATAEVLAHRYPEWDLFQQVRAELDPAGRFTNDHIVRLLGRVDAPRLAGGG